jgi:hypothetical protein
MPKTEITCINAEIYAYWQRDAVNPREDSTYNGDYESMTAAKQVHPSRSVACGKAQASKA